MQLKLPTSKPILKYFPSVEVQFGSVGKGGQGDNSYNLLVNAEMSQDFSSVLQKDAFTLVVVSLLFGLVVNKSNWIIYLTKRITRHWT